MKHAILAIAGAIMLATVSQASVDNVAVGEPNKAAARAELYRLINQVRTMKFGDQPAGVAGKQALANETPVTEPNKPSQPEPKPAAPKAEPAKPVEAAPIVQDPNTASNPFELAESLYKVGRFKEAAACYRVAMARAASDKRHKVSESDQAWMLFQVGNCFVKSDPAEAIKAYRQLITDYPSSEWTPIAVGREQIIQWYTANHITAKAEKPVEKQR